MPNLYGDDASEDFACEVKAIRKLAQQISIVLQADQDIIQDTLHRTTDLFPRLKDTCDVLDSQLDHLEYLALRDLGHDVDSKEFIDKKERFLNKLHKLRREASFLVALPVDSKGTRILPQRQHKDLRKALNELDFAVATERAILKTNRSMLELSISSYKGVHKTIGYAYARCVAESFASPSHIRPGGSIVSDPPGPIERSESRQWSFRHRVVKRYHPEEMNNSHHKYGGEKFRMTWCPVIGACPALDMVAAQIIPYTIGERRAAQVLGRHEKDEYECVWGTENGMMLARELEKAFDEGSIVFVPFQGELKIILLNQSLSNKKINTLFNHYRGFEPPELQRLTFGLIDGRLLRFKTSHRPSLVHLYIHALMAVLRRRRHRCPGWEDDIDKVFVGRAWPSCDGKLPRRGTVGALVAEVGDLLPSEVDRIVRQMTDHSGAVDIAQSEVREQDLDTATTIAGLWASQKQCETWQEVFEFLWPPFPQI